MESSDKFNCAVRVKEEPRDVSFTEDVNSIIDNKPDTKHFQNLKFLEENPIQVPQECRDNHVCELSEKMEIVFECKDAKPNLNLLAVKKFDNDSPNYSQNMINSNDYNMPNIIKREVPREVKKETFDAEKSNFNFNRESSLQNDRKRITKTSNYEDRLNAQFDTAYNKITYTCDICKKKFTTKDTFKTHIHSVHDKITHGCDICGKKFTQTGSLKTHVDSVHNGVTHSCDICGKTFTQKRYLKIHVDSLHNGVTHSCDICGKSYSRKNSLKVHIDIVHNRVTCACNICGKKYSATTSLKRHVDSSHNKITYKCDACGKTFLRKENLKNHGKVVHNHDAHRCDVCEKVFMYKYNLKRHVRSSHVGIV